MNEGAGPTQLLAHALRMVKILPGDGVELGQLQQIGRAAFRILLSQPMQNTERQQQTPRLSGSRRRSIAESEADLRYRLAPVRSQEPARIANDAVFPARSHRSALK